MVGTQWSVQMLYYKVVHLKHITLLTNVTTTHVVENKITTKNLELMLRNNAVLSPVSRRMSYLFKILSSLSSS